MDSEQKRNKAFISGAVLLIAIFVIVIGGTYPAREAAIREQNLNNYDTRVEQQLQQALIEYNAVLNRPHNIDELIASRDKLVSAYWSKYDFQTPIDLYTRQMGETWSLAPGKYNQRWVETCRKLADMHRDANQLSAAVVCYQSVLDHDLKYLGRSNVNLIRDYNNMGMVFYLLGTGFEEREKRLEEFKKASRLLNQALVLVKEQKLEGTPREATTLWNLYLVERDSGNVEAETIKARAQAIDKAMNRVCREP
ncbi:MAG: hypothetical protein IPP57_10155 [Candidatus Obscuribacter sp.]|jgi:hypothetical protein|nr:hypothetical protein [Candidatus Obscuribacter sp.]MBK9618306.1 hypothetical protein [Candidatus Obscuribacter sp.]MBK9771170.1 hypothetical protein [Candidatus Obscuribacter sp.]MDQ5965813.1 hypothetical protein [Cyanobacteriota bacterium erpe_2018_sw_39hr_WHONDRS-SW48-000098_B_bin.30]